MYKKQSFADRLSISFPVEVEKPDAIGYPKVVQKVVDGKIVNSVEFIIEDKSKEQDYTVDDFALENLLASGADLKELKFNQISLNAIDKFVNGLDSLPSLKSEN